MLPEPSYQKKKKELFGQSNKWKLLEGALIKLFKGSWLNCATLLLARFLLSLVWSEWYLEPQWSRYDHTATLKMEVTSHGRAEEQKEPGPWRAWSLRHQDLCYMRAEEARYLGSLLPVTQHGLHRYVAWWPCSLGAPVTHTVTTVFREIFGYKQSRLPI